jgi:hypothetical protein
VVVVVNLDENIEFSEGLVPLFFSDSPEKFGHKTLNWARGAPKEAAAELHPPKLENFKTQILDTMI